MFNQKRFLNIGLGVLLVLIVWPFWKIFVWSLDFTSTSIGSFFSTFFLVLIPISVFFGVAFLSRGFPGSYAIVEKVNYRNERELKQSLTLIVSSVVVFPFAFSVLLARLFCNHNDWVCGTGYIGLNILFLRPLAIILLILGLVKLRKYFRGHRPS